MSDTVYLPLGQITESATVNQLKYWSKLLGVRLVTRSRTAHVSEKDAVTLREVAALVAGGMSPSEACRNVAPKPSDVPAVSDSPGGDRAVMERLTGIEAAIMALVEENRRLRDDNTSLRGHLREQSDQIAALRSEVRAMLPAPQEQKATERSFSDELTAAVAEMKAFIAGAVAPFTSWLKLG